jgi:hypothetical protein
MKKLIAGVAMTTLFADSTMARSFGQAARVSYPLPPAAISRAA